MPPLRVGEPGPIDDTVFESLRDELVADLAHGGWDAVYLSLHGAAITRRRVAPELELARAVRDAVGAVPIAASFDLHANLNPALARLLDFATGYRTYPHVDMRDTAARALRQLERIVAGEIRPVGEIINTAAIHARAPEFVPALVAPKEGLRGVELCRDRPATVTFCCKTGNY